jgi:hypothetical protein
MTREQFIEMYNAAKHIEQLADYLYFHNKLRSEQIKAEARTIRNKIIDEIGQIDARD